MSLPPAYEVRTETEPVKSSFNKSCIYSKSTDTSPRLLQRKISAVVLTIYREKLALCEREYSTAVRMVNRGRHLLWQCDHISMLVSLSGSGWTEMLDQHNSVRRLCGSNPLFGEYIVRPLAPS